MKRSELADKFYRGIEDNIIAKTKKLDYAFDEYCNKFSERIAPFWDGHQMMVLTETFGELEKRFANGHIKSLQIRINKWLDDDSTSNSLFHDIDILYHDLSKKIKEFRSVITSDFDGTEYARLCGVTKAYNGINRLYDDLSKKIKLIEYILDSNIGFSLPTRKLFCDLDILCNLFDAMDHAMAEMYYELAVKCN